MSEFNTNITIVGGGLAGLATALALRDYPGTITLIEAVRPERQTQHEYDARAIVLSQGNRSFLQRIGVFEKIANVAMPILAIHVSDKGHFGKSHISAIDEQVPALGYVVEIPDLYNAFLDTTAELKHLNRICPAQVTRMKRYNDGWQLHFSDNSPRKTLTTECVLAADGTHSSIRHFLNLQSQTKDYEQHAIVANVTMKESQQYTAYERFSGFGPIALLPLSNQRVALIWVQPSDMLDTVMQWSDDQFLNELQHAFGFVAGEFIKVGVRATYPLKHVWLEQQVHHHCVFIGNAAHTLHPVAAQGFNLSLRDIQTLASGLLNSKVIDQDIFTTYFKARKSQQQRLFCITDLMVKTFNSSFSPLQLLRNVGLNFLDKSRFTKHLFARYMMGLTDLE